MTITETEIEGLVVLSPHILSDNRGAFFKTFHNEDFNKLKLKQDWKEEYFSISNENVIRGMHFQAPPYMHHKMVTCLRGSVLDVVVDLRKDLETFGKVYSLELNESNKKILIIPEGCAHGFLSLQDNSLMFYKVSSIYNPNYDFGVRWDSIDFNWPVAKPITSQRDQHHPSFLEFDSPFSK